MIAFQRLVTSNLAERFLFLDNSREWPRRVRWRVRIQFASEPGLSGARILAATVVNGRLSSANDGAFVICDGLMMISVASRMCLLSARSPFAVFMIAAIKSNDEAVNYVLMMMTFRAAVRWRIRARCRPRYLCRMHCRQPLPAQEREEFTAKGSH